MAKKGMIQEILSKARFSGHAEDYRIFYRDFNAVKEKNLPEFIRESGNFEAIPATRIQLIKKNNTVLFEKTKTKRRV